VDVNEVIRDIPHAHRHLLGERLTLRLSLDPAIAPAWMDFAQLEQVLVNLFVNARDAMAGAGTLIVATSPVSLEDGESTGWPESKAGQYVRVAVTDTGSGIPADALPQIFEPFFTTKAPGKGTGLGLSLVYGVVRQSGGRIGVTTAVGTGTTFTIDLPAAAVARQPAAARPADTAPARGTETILVAEDEQAVRELVRSMMAGAGYQVLVAGSGQEALAIAAEHAGPIQLLLTDVVMPGMNGRELAEHLAAVRPDTRILFMTGYTDDAVVQHGVLGGAIALLPKPFSRQELLKAIRDVLDSPWNGIDLPRPGGRR
jgi:two-component system, cell cycle sensor histidine kinase and response regulator CckA